jgi:hypothetical protein
MSKHTVTKNIRVLGVSSLLLLTFVYPVIAFQPPQPQTTHTTYTETAHPESYEITIYRIKGPHVEKIIKQVPYDDAIAIKNAYQNIENNDNSPMVKTEQKLTLLRRYNIVSDDDTIAAYKEEALTLLSHRGLLPIMRNLVTKNNPTVRPRDEVNFIFDIFGFVNGRFYGNTVNVLNLILIGSPLIIQSAEGGEITDYFLFFYPLHLKKTRPLVFVSLLFVGLILLVPFVSPDGGEITGVSFYTMAI